MQGREEGRDAASAARASVKQEAITDLEPISFVCLDVHKEVEVVKELYNSLIEAKLKCGESIDGLSFPKFHRLVAAKSDGLKERHRCDRVTFLVAVENGHVSFKAKAE